MKNICFQLNRKLWMSLALLVCVALPGFAQKITVHGYVDDDLGEPLIGATVMEKGTTNGTATDIDGNFTLNVDPNATLVVSYVGYDPMEVHVNGRTDIKITMLQNAQMLAETVVIGYGSVKKSDATGSVAVIKPDEIDAGISVTAQDMLVGASPGVVVTTNGGDPTGGATIRIRGGSSLSANNNPLIVIDGVPMTDQSQGGGMNALTMVNPNDIESMTILKDASATAIYGSRASNGVIIITTKKGKAGKPVVNITANMSVNTARKTLKVMKGQEFADFVLSRGLAQESDLGYNGTIYDTDWQKEVLRTAISQEYTASIAGKVGFLPYRVNAGYTNNQGIIKTSKMDRVTAGFSLTPKFFNDLLSINVNVNGTYADSRNNDMGGYIAGAISYDPTKPVYNDIVMGGDTGLKLWNGFYNVDNVLDTNYPTNPLGGVMASTNNNKTYSSSGNFQVDYALHFLPDLHLNLNLGYQVSKNDQRAITEANSVNAWRNTSTQPNNAFGAGTLYKWYELQRNTLLDFYLNYKKDFEAIKSGLDVMVGYSWQRFDYHGRSRNYVNTLGFVNADGNGGFSTDPYYMNWSTHNAIGEPVGYAEEDHWSNPLQLVSFFGRLNYTFDDTYLLTFTLRDDGSSRFSKSTRWGLFPSLALGMKINNIGKLRDVAWLNELKLRLGWGETGQQDINSFFPYMPVYTVSDRNGGFQYPSYSNPGQWIFPIYPNPYDENIKWETTTTWNVGLDFGIFNNRLSINVDWYLRNTRDLLAYTPAHGMNTSDYLTTNIGSLRNQGFEVTLSGRPVETQDFTWTSSLNIAYNENKITKLTGNAATDVVAARNLPVGNGGALQYHMVGKPAYTFRVFQQVYDSNGNPIPDVYVDQNGDGKITDEDKIDFHSPDPTTTLNWNNNFSWKNWDLSFSLRASIGNYVYNGPRYERTILSHVNSYGLHNLLRNEFYFDNAGSNLALSDYFIENASFLRCDNITLGYTWPYLCNDHLRLRLYGAVQNPFVITKYKGIDPEVFSGIDSSVYPKPVSFTIGLIATF